MVKISIVVPVYNSIKYLDRCINSILKQTFLDFELILINDGSTDSSFSVMKKYETDSRVKCYSQKNKGIAATRNRGIDLASGEYIMFIDNDDYIKEDYLMHYVTKIEEDESDVVIGNYQRVLDNGKVLVETHLVDGDWSKYMIVAPWAKLYRLSFIKRYNIQFLNSNIGEDIYFNMQVMNLTKNISIIEDNGYQWFYNEKSVSNTVHKKANKELMFEYLLDSTYDKMVEIGCFNDALVEYFFIKTICWFVSYVKRKTGYKDVISYWNYYMEWLKKKYPNYQRNKYLSIFKPKEESLKNRLGVFLLVKGYRYHFDSLIIRFL